MCQISEIAQHACIRQINVLQRLEIRIGSMRANLEHDSGNDAFGKNFNPVTSSWRRRIIVGNMISSFVFVSIASYTSVVLRWGLGPIGSRLGNTFGFRSENSHETHHEAMNTTFSVSQHVCIHGVKSKGGSSI